MSFLQEFFNDFRFAVRQRNLEHLHAKYERYFSPVAVLSGFIWDNLTLKRIDLWLENVVLIAYLAIAVAAIFFLNLYEGGRFRNAFFQKGKVLAPFVLQFVFGGLFSAFIVFYLRSASLFTSWPFLFFLGLLLVGNELFRKRYLRVAFQVSIFFIALFSYTTLVTPIILGQMGPFAFMAGGMLALAIISIILFLFFLLLPRGFVYNKTAIAGSVVGIYILFNFFYFTNVIPPIPLSLKEGGVYHEVTRAGNDTYRLTGEKLSWYETFIRVKKFHRIPGDPVYVFSSVFAPTKIRTGIYHQWNYFDEKKDIWVTKERIQFSIVGGRDGGYRGYTMKQRIDPGRWRVDIKTERGQLLGRIEFDVVSTDVSPPIFTKIR